MPLCLLTQAMQNRRIIDALFREAGAEIRAMIETNSLVTLWSHVRFGQWATVVPHTFLLLLPQHSDVIALPLVAPDASHVIGLVAADREPMPPLTRELFAVANQTDLPTQIEKNIALPTVPSRK
jgi:DNA-binding transcriptional LysR family regulator